MNGVVAVSVGSRGALCLWPWWWHDNNKKGNDYMYNKSSCTLLEFYIICCFLFMMSVYKPEYDAAWPLQERETQILDDNRCNLVDIMDPCDLITRKFSKGVINYRQYTHINSLPNNTQKSEALLDILRRGSEENYWKTVLCLRESNQSHVAEILKDGGGTFIYFY